LTNLSIFFNNQKFNLNNITINIIYNEPKLILLDTRVINYNNILSSLYLNVYYILIDYNNDTFDSLLFKINNLNINKFLSFGIINNNYFFKTFKLLNNQLIPSIIPTNLDFNVYLYTWNEIINFFKTINITYNTTSIDLIIPYGMTSDIVSFLELILNVQINSILTALGGTVWYYLINYYFYLTSQLTNTSLYPILQIIANSFTKYYDKLLFTTPSYSFNASGNQAFSISGTLTWSGTYLSAIDVSNGYTIIPSGISSNIYLVNYINGILTILPSNLYITANKTLLYGYNNINLDIQYFGLVNGENFTSFNFTNANLILNQYYGVGNYEYTLNNITSYNYNISFIPGNIIINPALLYIIAKNISKLYDNIPFISNSNDIIYNGYSYNDNIFSLSGSLHISGNSQGAINPGQYNIIISGYTSINYNIIYYPGILTIYPNIGFIKANDFVQFYN
jgi:hypothetical protein